MKNYISIKDISIKFDTDLVIDKLSFEIDKGDKIAIVGSSGKGKSTILNSLLGFLKPSEGSIQVDGVKLNDKNIASIRKLTSWLPQELPHPSCTAKDLLLAPFEFSINKHNLPSAKTINSILEKMELDSGILDKEISEISGGQKQRLLIASCLLLKKEIFIADEPTSALDTHTKKTITDFILSKTDLTVIVATHDEYWINQSSKILTL